MNYCLRCNKPCPNLSHSGSEIAVFCDECRSLLRKRLPVGNKAEAPKDFDLLHTSLWQEGHEIDIASLADGEPASNAQGRAESIPTFGTFASWRSQGPFATLPRVESFPQSISSVQTPLTTPHSPDSSAQCEVPTPSQEREGEQDTQPRPPGARPQQEAHGRDSNGWTNHGDPLMARLGTHKLPPELPQKETGSRRSIPVPQTGRSRPYARYVAIALVALTILVVGVLVLNGAVFTGIIQQHNVKIFGSSPMLNATTDTTPGAQSLSGGQGDRAPTPSLSLSPSPSLSPSASPGVGKPTATASATTGSPTPGTTASATPTPTVSSMPSPGTTPTPKVTPTPTPGVTPTPTSGVTPTPSPTPKPLCLVVLCLSSP